MKNISLTKCLFIIVFVGIYFVSCKKEDAVPALPPNVLYFQITKNGNYLPDSILKLYKMYYMNDIGEKVYRHPSETMVKPEHIYLPSEYGPNYHLDSNGVRYNYWIFDYQDRDWYLESPNGEIDTIRIIAKMRKTTEGYDDECYCWDPLTTVKFNGHEAPKHPTLKAYDGKRVYIFEK